MFTYSYLGGLIYIPIQLENPKIYDIIPYMSSVFYYKKASFCLMRYIIQLNKKVAHYFLLYYPNFNMVLEPSTLRTQVLFTGTVLLILFIGTVHRYSSLTLFTLSFCFKFCVFCANLNCFVLIYLAGIAFGEGFCDNILLPALPFGKDFVLIFPCQYCH